MGRKLRMGMVGGGPGAFIGAVHHKAAIMDGGIELVAGVFGSTARKSRQVGRELELEASRVYADYQAMIEKESALPDGERIDFVTIATPNHLHFSMARDFLQAGFHVMCEKPMTLTAEQALELKAVVGKQRRVFGLMHNYTGYPMVKLARDMVEQGDLGGIRKVVVHYKQGWLARDLEKSGQKQAAWRTDPKQSGAAGCMGDIGTHAANLAEYITGLKVRQVCADLTTFVPGRALDDDGSVLLRFSKGAKGVLHASQISIGEENNLAIWVYGEDRSLEWHQEEPNTLTVNSIDGAKQVWCRGNDYVAGKSAAAARGTRLPSGHPEAFLEAFANNYLNFADTVRAREERRKPDQLELDFPGVVEGVRGMQFIEGVVASSKKGAVWVRLPA
jgi:predicted dehydrogenase